MMKTIHEKHMKWSHLAMNDHSGALVLQPLHCWGRCNTWNYYGCRNPKMTGRISCCHPSISPCWVQKRQRLKHTNAPTEAKDSSEIDIFLSAELTWAADKPLTSSLCPLQGKRDITVKSQPPCVQTGADTLQLVHTSLLLLPSSQNRRELLTALQRCPMPLILKDPVGWDESSLRYTGDPAILVRARLCLTGVATWRGCWVFISLWTSRDIIEKISKFRPKCFFLQWSLSVTILRFTNLRWLTG